MSWRTTSPERRGNRVEARFLQPFDVVEYADHSRAIVAEVHLVEGARGTDALVIHHDGVADRLMHPASPVRLIVAAT